jgi:RNA polymerase sigma-70 factor, ECF subfamily
MPSHEHLEPLADDALLRNVGQGCADCFALLFRRYCRQVYSVSFRILRDKAETEDVLQDVFLSIYLQHERFDPTLGSVKTWILQFAYFKALLRRRYLRVRNYYKQEEISEIKDTRANLPSDLLGMTPPEWACYVETGIATLGPKHRRIIELVHFEGYTLQEAAEIQRETLGSTRNYYYRGLQVLRDFLGAQTASTKKKEKLVLERNDAPCEPQSSK